MILREKIKENPCVDSSNLSRGTIATKMFFLNNFMGLIIYFFIFLTNIPTFLSFWNFYLSEAKIKVSGIQE